MFTSAEIQLWLALPQNHHILFHLYIFVSILFEKTIVDNVIFNFFFCIFSGAESQISSRTQIVDSEFEMKC